MRNNGFRFKNRMKYAFLFFKKLRIGQLKKNTELFLYRYIVRSELIIIKYSNR